MDNLSTHTYTHTHTHTQKKMCLAFETRLTPHIHAHTDAHTRTHTHTHTHTHTQYCASPLRRDGLSCDVGVQITPCEFIRSPVAHSAHENERVKTHTRDSKTNALIVKKKTKHSPQRLELTRSSGCAVVAPAPHGVHVPNPTAFLKLPTAHGVHVSWVCPSYPRPHTATKSRTHVKLRPERFLSEETTRMLQTYLQSLRTCQLTCTFTCVRTEANRRANPCTQTTYK